jgi:hypothetical protein
MDREKRVLLFLRCLFFILGLVGLAFTAISSHAALVI